MVDTPGGSFCNLPIEQMLIEYNACTHDVDLTLVKSLGT